MKSVNSIGRIENESLVSAVLFCVLAVFMGFMFTSVYLAQERNSSDHGRNLVRHTEKTAVTMGYFFSERRHDLEIFSRSRELQVFFENQALGMSMKYGLASSLVMAANGLSGLKASRIIDQDPIYGRIVFVAGNGKALVDTDMAGLGQVVVENGPLPAKPSEGLFWKQFLKPGTTGGEITALESGLLVSVPVYFKKSYAGQLLAFLNHDTIYENLMKPAGDSGQFFCLAEGDTLICPPGEMPLPISHEFALDSLGREAARVGGIKGNHESLIGMKIPVPGTRFSMVSLARAPSKTLARGDFIASMAAFAGIVIAGLFFLWRTATQELIMGVRLDEAEKKKAELEWEIREREKAETEVRENEKRFRELADRLPVPIGEYDFNYNVRYVNQAALDWLGYTREEIMAGVGPLKLIPEKHVQLLRKRKEQFEKGENPGPVDMDFTTKDGRQIWGQVIPSLIYENGVCVGIRSCFIDLTQRRKLERESLLAADQEKYALVGQVAGKMAHDFNNILGGIMGNAELCLLDCSDPETAQVFSIILEQAKRGTILTRNLVAFAKDQEIKEEYIDINDKIDLVLRILAKELDGVRVAKGYGKTLPPLLADPGMIEHALVNLIQNAVHAMARVADPLLVIHTCVEENSLAVGIRDNGCGIHQKYFSDIYSPSFTLKGGKDRVYGPDIKGTGYGLSNVKKYIEKHGGEISFTSEIQKGTCFRILLPLEAKMPDASPHESRPVLPVIKKKHILIVEDEDVISSVQYRVLTRAPHFHKVWVAKDGPSAISLFESRPFDLVSLDHILEGPLTGLDIYKHIRNQGSRVPVVFVSGNIRFLESMDSLKATDPYMDNLSKPCESLVYACKINQLLQPDL